MSSMKQELIERLSEHQDKIWEVTTTTVAESGTNLTFASPLTLSSKLTDLSAELSGQFCTIQFSLAHNPEAFQLILIPQEAVADIATLISGAKVSEVDENTLGTIRPSLEAIVQGLCLAIGTLRSSPIAASGLTIRYQELSFPANMEALDEVVRMQVAVSGEDVSGAVIWLMDPASAAYICGIEMEERPGDASVFAPLEGGGGFAGSGYSGTGNPLDLLMDIPLEISVELGRMKMLVRDVIELGTGSIVEIDKAAGEPVDVMVNGRLVAKGEVVVIEDNFGVRITEIITPHERLMRLAEVA